MRFPLTVGAQSPKQTHIPLTLPMSGLQNFETCLRKVDYEVVQRKIGKIAVIDANTPEVENSEIEILRTSIFNDYEGTVFRDKVFPEPPSEALLGTHT